MMICDGLLHYRIDNEASSVNNPAKVFCVCDEYKEMWAFAKQESQRFEAVKHLIPILQVATYTWNYNRLSPSLRKSFIKKWSSELRVQIKNGLLDLKVYNFSKRLKLLRLAFLPFSIRTSNHV